MTVANALREALLLREAGDLPAALERLAHAMPQAGLADRLVQLRLLFELQDYATLQRQVEALVEGMTRRALVEAGGEAATELLHFAELCAIPAPLLERLARQIAPMEKGDPDLAVTLNAIRLRAKFRADLAAKYNGSVSLVSLGLNCLPWHLPQRWGFRRPRAFSYLMVPCSLAGHTIPGVIAALEDDFAGYCTPEKVRVVKTQRGHSMAMRTDRGAFWNHHRSPYWLKDDFAALRATMAEKAENFRQACKRPNVAFLMATCPVRYPEEPLDFLPRLQAALARHTGTDRNRILITNQTTPDRPPELLQVDETVRFAYCAYPSKEYVWHDEAQADAKEGLAFERQYVGLLTRTLRGWKLLRAKPQDGPAGRSAA